MAKRDCDACGRSYTAKRANSRFCSDTCRKRGQRGQISAAVRESSADEPEIVAVTREELEAAGRVRTVLGQSALELARSIPNAGDSAKSGLVKELRAVMSAAVAGAKVAADPLDELRMLRERKRNAG
jgi:hypothetical protein